VRKILQDHDEDESPLFLYLPLQNDHAPLPDIPDDYFSSEELTALGETVNLEDVTTERVKFLRLNLYADKFIERLVTNLKDYGYYENSIIFVTSDNGACFQAGGSNYPLRGTKHYLYNGGVKVPAFVHSPLIPEEVRGTTFSGYLHISDMFPTMARLAGADKEFLEMMDIDLDGNDMWSSIIGEDEGTNLRDSIIVSFDPYTTEYTGDDDEYLEYLAVKGNFIGALIQGPYKYIHNEYNVSWYSTSTTVDSDEHPECSAIYTSYNKTHSLFNLDDDPYETENLLHTNMSILAENGLTYNEIASDMSAVLKVLMDTQIDSAYLGQDFSSSKPLWESYSNNICPWGDMDRSYIKLQSGVEEEFDITDVLGERYGFDFPDEFISMHVEEQNTVTKGSAFLPQPSSLWQ